MKVFWSTAGFAFERPGRYRVERGGVVVGAGRGGGRAERRRRVRRLPGERRRQPRGRSRDARGRRQVGGARRRAPITSPKRAAVCGPRLCGGCRGSRAGGPRQRRCTGVLAASPTSCRIAAKLAKLLSRTCRRMPARTRRAARGRTTTSSATAYVREARHEVAPRDRTQAVAVATNFDLAPPPVNFDGKTAVPIDISAIDAHLTFDGAASAASGDATLTFVVGPAAGRPMFDLRQTITGVWLDGAPLAVGAGADARPGRRAGRRAASARRSARRRIEPHAPLHLRPRAAGVARRAAVIRPGSPGRQARGSCSTSASPISPRHAISRPGCRPI